MKKKKLLLTLLALAIVTSVTAGTLAVYTKSVDLNADVVIKKFAMSVGGKIDSNQKSIKLAPTESESYSFSVSNQDEEGISEVPLLFEVNIDFVNAVDSMKGLTAVLSGDGLEEPVTITSGDYGFKFETVPGKATSNNYKLLIQWNDDDDETQTNQGTAAGTNGLKVTVRATQII